MGVRTQNLGKEGYLLEFIGTLTGVGITRSPVRGSGTAFSFSASIIGKTLKFTDSGATSVTEKTVTFTRTNLGITGGSNSPPTLAQVVAALNSVFVADVAPTVASAGADGRLVVTGLGDLTVGAGTANVEFGWPTDGITLKHGTGATITFPTSFLGTGYTEYLYTIPRFVTSYSYTAATGVQATTPGASQVIATATPSARTLVLTGGAAGQSHVIVEY